MQIELLTTHQEAFSVNGNLLAAEKHLPATVRQDIQKNNSFTNLSLTPQFNYILNLGNARLSLGAGIPILLLQDYKGILFDRNQLRIVEGAIFEDKRFNDFGMQFNHSLSLPVTQSLSLGYQLSYQKWNGATAQISGYQQANLQSFSLGIKLICKL